MACRTMGDGSATSGNNLQTWIYLESAAEEQAVDAKPLLYLGPLDSETSQFLLRATVLSCQRAPRSLNNTFERSIAVESPLFPHLQSI